VLGVRAGDRVATLMDKSREYLVTLSGIWRIGAVHVPLFTPFAPPAISMRLNGSRAKVVVCDPAQRARLDPGEGMSANPGWRLISTGQADERALAFQTPMAGAGRFPAPVITNGDAPIIHIYTSGTTGLPKAAWCRSRHSRHSRPTVSSPSTFGMMMYFGMPQIPAGPTVFGLVS
jgi:acetyl-CoA synthetase